MRSDRYYTPSSPLSPRMPTQSGHLSPSSTRQRGGLSVPSSQRKFHMEIPSYEPVFSQRSAAATPSSRAQSPAYNLHRGPQPTPMEVQQRALRKQQQDLIKQLQLSSKLAASPLAVKPGAPRLDPLGSPKGPMTPLALDQHEPVDYFTVVGTGKLSPAASPGGRSSRAHTSNKDEIR